MLPFILCEGVIEEVLQPLEFDAHARRQQIGPRLKLAQIGKQLVKGVEEFRVHLERGIIGKRDAVIVAPIPGSVHSPAPER